MRLLKIIMLVSVLSLWACTEIDEPISVPRDNSVTENSKYRTETELKNIALQAYSAIKGHDIEEVASRASGSITITPILPRLSRASSDTLIQVVNYGNGQGFALVGAQKGSEDLLALVEEGDYNPMEVSQVEGFEDFISRAEYLLSSKPNIGDTAICLLNTKVVRDYVRTDIDGPHIKTQWGQFDYFGAYCPNHICGCEPLAVAMVMSYLEKPNSMAFAFPERDVAYSELDWAAMKSHFKRHNDEWPSEWNGMPLPASGCPASDMDHANLGRVVRQIGYDLHSIYLSDMTATLSAGPPIEYFKQVIPDVVTELYSSPTQKFLGGLQNGIALVDSDDHSWVIDGFAMYIIYENTYRDFKPNTIDGDWRLIKREVVDSNTLLHHNWGWNGMCNGYFLPVG